MSQEALLVKSRLGSWTAVDGDRTRGRSGEENGRIRSVRMSENPNVLIAEATKVVTDSERYLEAAEELVVGIPTRREAAKERAAAAQKLIDEAREEMWRVATDESAGRAEEREAEKAYERASRDAMKRVGVGPGSDDLDPENRKAVARQIAGLVREDAESRLRYIAARSDDPEVRRTVDECKDTVATSTYRFMRRFAEARSLILEEVRTTRAEAHAIFYRLTNPPVDQ